MYDSVNVSVSCGDYGLTVTGKTQIFDGYLAIYGEAKTKEKDKEEGENALLPPLEQGDVLKKIKLNSEQRFTKPPARFTEASLIKAMEERGIGRPSTYATVMQTLYKREYVTKESKALVPSKLGIQVTEYLEQYFSEVVDVDFTAEMEERLDSIEENAEPWYKVVDSFYKPLIRKVDRAMHGEKVFVEDEVSDVTCDKCGAPMVIKTGRYGKYLACSNYPKCSNIKSLKEKNTPQGNGHSLRTLRGKNVGKRGKIRQVSCLLQLSQLQKPPNLLRKRWLFAPNAERMWLKRVSKKGTVFYGCTGYPECDFVSWDVPTGKLCPKCGAHLVYKESRGKKTIRCSNRECDYNGGEVSES